MTAEPKRERNYNTYELNRAQLVRNPFFSHMKTEHIEMRDVSILLGQWWHPLRFFPNFLSKSIAVAPELPAKTAISRILFQELGEGSPEHAHERLYVSTMTSVGFNSTDLIESPPLKATQNLVDGYAKSTEKWSSALGFVYATETVDLFLVGSLGAAVSRVTGKEHLPWVEIHVAQEPDHVSEATTALSLPAASVEMDEVLEHAGLMWSLWDDFFSGLDNRIFNSHATGRSRAV